MMHLVIAGLVGLAMVAGPAAAFDIAAQKRILVIQAESPEDPAFRQQRDALLSEREGLRERDMLVYARFGDGTVAPVFGTGLSASRMKSHSKPLFDRPGFTIVLLGKDGGVKKTSRTPLPAGDFFALIDTMPMRRQEMRRGS